MDGRGTEKWGPPLGRLRPPPPCSSCLPPPSPPHARTPPPEPSAERFRFKHQMYKLREERNIKPSAFAQLVSATLYEKRFGPYFCQPVIAGLQPDGTPYLCGMDSIGAIETAKDFMIAGTASDALLGICESLWRPDMVRGRAREVGGGVGFPSSERQGILSIAAASPRRPAPGLGAAVGAGRRRARAGGECSPSPPCRPSAPDRRAPTSCLKSRRRQCCPARAATAWRAGAPWSTSCECSPTQRCQGPPLGCMGAGVLCPRCHPRLARAVAPGSPRRPTPPPNPASPPPDQSHSTKDEVIARQLKERTV